MKTSNVQHVIIYTELLIYVLSDFSAGAWNNCADLRRGSISHYEHVRSIVAKDNLLEFRSEDGWGPLCEFLGKTIPDEMYPHVNEGKHTAEIHKGIVRSAGGRAIG